jgi:TonB family protein
MIDKRACFLGVAKIAIAVASVLIPVVLASGQQNGIYDGHQPGITLPKPVKRVDPEYDPSAKAEKIEGPVKLLMVISKEGKPVTVSVREGLDPRLDRKAVAAAKLWQFEPARLNGAPVAFRLTLQLNFRLSHDTRAPR